MPRVPYYAGDVVGIPVIVLDLVIQVILSSRPPFHFTTLSIVPTDPSLCDTTLGAMSLVHRSWTLLCQRALGTRLCVEGIRGLKGALDTPIFGTWTGEVSFKWRWNDRDEIPMYSSVYGGPSKEVKERGSLMVDREKDHDNPDGEPPEDVIALLATLLRKLNNTRFLSIWTYFAECESNLFDLLLNTIAGLNQTLEALWLAHDRGHVDSDCGCPYLRELCIMLPGLTSLRHLSLYEWTAPTYTKEEEEFRIGWHSRRKFMLPDRSHLGTPAPLPMETSPSPTLKSLDLEWETPCLPSDFAAWLVQPRCGYSLDCIRLAVNVVIGPGPERFYNELVPVVSVHVQGVRKAFFEIDNWSPWRRSEHIPFLGEMVAPLVSNVQSVQDLRVRLAGYIPSGKRPYTLLSFPSSVESLYIKTSQYGDVQTEQWLWRVDDFLYQTLSENSLPRLRLFVLTHDIACQKWGRREKAAADSTMGVWRSRSYDAKDDTPSDVPPLTLRVEEFCTSRNVTFVYTNDPDLYHDLAKV